MPKWTKSEKALEKIARLVVVALSDDGFTLVEVADILARAKRHAAREYAFKRWGARGRRR